MKVKFENFEKEKTVQNPLSLQSTNIGNYLDWMKQYVKTEMAGEDLLIQSQQEDGTGKENAPFLSVISRTQGKRPEALREMLLSLAGQSCMDFEILVMGHNLNEEQDLLVRSIIRETPGYLREKIRMIPVTGGNRTTPINRGFEEATGTYAVLLDDDDLVMDNWVEAFYDKAQESPGCVLHAYVIAQKWKSLEDRNGNTILRAVGSPENQFCYDFDIFTELYGNRCPVLGLAFPMYPFRNMGIRFDETLDTTEDWDFLMRISSFCGVADIKEPTSIYRLWANSENSHTLHNKKIWDDNRDKIREKIRSKPLILKPYEVSALMDLIDDNPEIFMKKKEAEVTPLYYDTGNGYNETECIRVGSLGNGNEIVYHFTGFGEKPISSLRWDPSEYGNLYVENILAQIYTTSGHIIKKRFYNFGGNGFHMLNKIVFFHPDPQLIINLGRKKQIEKVVITGTVHMEVTESMHNELTMWYDFNPVSKGKKATKLVLKKVLKKR